MKKLIISMLTMTIVILSMTVSVFAWFTVRDNAYANDLTGSIVAPGLVLDLDVENSQIYVGDMIRDLTYLSETEFSTLFSSLDKYSSLLKITVTNRTAQDYQGKLKLNITSYESDIFSGPRAGFKYMIFEEKTQLLELILSNENNSELNIEELFLENNNTEFEFDAANTEDEPSKKDLYIFFWGNYDGLSDAEKAVYHALIYYLGLSFVQ